MILLMVSPVGFSQEGTTVAKQIIGKWDVVLEKKSPKFSEADFKTTKKRAKKTVGNSNIALFKFNEDGKFHLTSIKDYSQSDEDGTFELSEDKTRVSRTVNYPRHLNKKKQSKFVKLKAKILYIDSSFLVMRSRGITYYMHKIGK